jgi:hypothetical protein
MPRLILIAATGALAALWASQALADDNTSSAQTTYLSWPSKPGAATETPKSSDSAGGAVALPKQFFAGGGGADLAAPPGPLMPHSVPGSPAVTNTATANTAANRARADMLTPTGDQSTDQ